MSTEPKPMSAAKHVSSFETLSGIDKAAVIFLVLGEERSGHLLGQMEQRELISVSRAMVNIGKVPPHIALEACTMFKSKMTEGEIMVGSAFTAERLLSKFLPEDRVSSIMNEIKAPVGRTIWEKIANVNHAALSTYLMGEGAQTAAVVLSSLVPDYTAKVFEALPKDFTVEIVKRMIDLDSVPRESVKEIEGILSGEFMVNYNQGGLGSEPTGFLAEIFNRTRSDLCTSILETIAEERPEDVAKIQARMFTFADLAAIDISAASSIMSEVPREVLTLALKGAPQAVADRFLGSVADRVANIIKDEMQIMGPQRLRDINNAQDQVLKIAKKLEESGQIVLRLESEDDRMIE